MRHGKPARRVSIAWKLTGFFFIFGVALSYGTFIAYGKASATTVLRVGAGMAASAFESSFPVRDASALRRLAGSPVTGFSSLKSAVPFFAGNVGISAPRLYGREPGGGWLAFYEGTDGLISSAPATKRVDRALRHRFVHLVAVDFMPTFLPGRTFEAFLSLPKGPDGTEWALGARVGSDDLLKFLSDNGTETLYFMALLAALSLILGRLFARRFIKPIAKLADAAEAYGTSHDGSAFHSDRRDEIGILGRTLAGMAAEIEAKRSETESRLSTMEAMNRIDKAVLSTASRGELLARVAGIVDGTMRSRSVAIALRDEARSGWEIGALIDRTEGGTLEGYAPFVSDSLLDAEVPTLFRDYYESSIRGAKRGIAMLAYDVMDSASGRFVAAPLVVDGAYLGSLIIVAGADEALSDDERRTFAMLADQAAVALRSILEHEAREDNFFGVIRSLSRAIDAKSRWTAGHSERVAETAIKLGQALKLPSDAVSSLRISATLHDVGKIGIGEAILDKPGTLSQEEYDAIKLHPTIGAAMLQGIRSFEPVVPAVLYHHERWDGTGYPEGLAGAGIPIAARIIAIADVWDAICDDRPYRKGFSRERARSFMEAGSGTMFDPMLVDTFLGLLDLDGGSA